MLQLIAQAAQQAQQAAPQVSGDGLIGGGIVGAFFGLYVVYEKWSKRQTEARREAMADEETQLKLDAMARTAMAKAHEEERKAWQDADAARKAARDIEMAGVKAQILIVEANLKADRERLTELESREQKCQSECSALKKENATQAAKILEMEATITSLRGQIETLTEKLKANGSLPTGTGEHQTLKGQ